VLAATAAANALILLDQTSTTVALPAIQDDFGASRAETQWVMGAYLLSLASLMAASGRLADRYGRRRMFLLGVTIFGGASVACALAPSELALILARFAQGIGAALTQPLALANATAALPRDRQGWVVGFLGGVGSACLALGPIVGGLLVDVASWRWIFLINVPIVAVALVQAARCMPESRDREAPALDVPGMALLFAGLAVLVAALLHAQELSAPVVAGALGLALAALLAFARVERSREHPAIPLPLLRRPAVAGSLIGLLALQLAVLAVTVYVLFDLQRSLGYGALEAGLLFLPAVVWSPLLSTVTGRLADRHGSRRLVVGGLALTAAGLAGIAVGALEGEIWILLPCLVVFGLSRPFVFTPASTAAIKSIPAHERGLASSLVTEARQLGAVLGVAVAAAVVAAVQSSWGGTLAEGVAAAMAVCAAVAAAATLAAIALMPRAAGE
jgi:EmrB/QacA subfamily drug resistance transporter